MQRARLALAAIAFGTARTLNGCAAVTHRTTTVESGGDVTANTAVVPIDSRTIPVGAQITATLDQPLGTNISNTSDNFSATVSIALLASDGSVVVPAGSKIEGHVTALQPSTDATKPALIRLAFDRIRMNGETYPFSAAIVQSSPVQTSTQSSADRTKQIIIGGAVGAALGGLIGGKDKLIIGGALGAAAGSIISLGTEVNATLPAGSQMTVQATQMTQIR